jgi:hypothetical protein
MYEESYIDQNQLKDAFVEGLTFQFKKATMSKIHSIEANCPEKTNQVWWADVIRHLRIDSFTCLV